MTKGLHVTRNIEDGIDPEVAERLIAAGARQANGTALQLCTVGQLAATDGGNWTLAALVVAPPLVAVVTEGFVDDAYTGIEVTTYRLDDVRAVVATADHTHLEVAVGGTTRLVRVPRQTLAVDVLPRR